MHTSFPDKTYLEQLLTFQRSLTNKQEDPIMELLAHSGANLNWIGDYLSDQSLTWEKENLSLDQLWLTGVNPQWNKYIIDEAKRDPMNFRKLAEEHPEFHEWMKETALSNLAILVRYEDAKYKVLDGMHMVLFGLLNKQETIEAYIAYPNSYPQPQCEAHVVYDFFRSYTRGINKDRDGLIAALKFMNKSYVNVKDLLLDRLGPTWQSHDEITLIINEVLKE